ncbi:glutaredoxin domain-containing protein [Priestia filamentosa]|uniref:glutaredoxin domain-containing protein n=1 Tax=Priestia filamentosa TaxID=1402861 RepID=UPI00397D8552
MAITVYTKAGCSSSRKAMQFFKENNIEFTQKDVSQEFMDFQQFQQVLSSYGEGTTVILTRNYVKLFEPNGELEDYTLKDIHGFLKDEFKGIKTPIITEYKYSRNNGNELIKNLIGYNEDEIRQFIPRYMKNREFEAVAERTKKYLYAI